MGGYDLAFVLLCACMVGGVGGCTAFPVWVQHFQLTDIQSGMDISVHRIINGTPIHPKHIQKDWGRGTPLKFLHTKLIKPCFNGVDGVQ